MLKSVVNDKDFGASLLYLLKFGLCLTLLSIFYFACINPILHGGGINFYDFVPFNIRKVLCLDFFLKFPKDFMSTIFSIYNPKGPSISVKMH